MTKQSYFISSSKSFSRKSDIKNCNVLLQYNVQFSFYLFSWLHNIWNKSRLLYNDYNIYNILLHICGKLLYCAIHPKTSAWVILLSMYFFFQNIPFSLFSIPFCLNRFNCNTLFKNNDRIGAHYFHAWCPYMSVRPKNTKTSRNVGHHACSRFAFSIFIFNNDNNK